MYECQYLTTCTWTARYAMATIEQQRNLADSLADTRIDSPLSPGNLQE
jgi:hypothetical protein